MKVFISNGLRGKQDPKAYVERCRAAVDAYFSGGELEYERIDTYWPDYDGNRLQFLGKSISDGLAQADVAVFMDDWHNYDGCFVEHAAAMRYNVPIVYLSSI
jgi:hypothetical protein